MKIGQIVKATKTWDTYLQKYINKPCKFFIADKDTENDDVLLEGYELDTFSKVYAFESDCTLTKGVSKEIREAIDSYANCFKHMHDEIMAFEKIRREYRKRLILIEEDKKAHLNNINLLFGADPNAPKKIILIPNEPEITYDFKEYPDKRLLKEQQGCIEEIQKQHELQKESQRIIDDKTITKYHNQDNDERLYIYHSEKLVKEYYTELFIIQEEMKRRKIEFTEFPIEDNQPLYPVFDEKTPDYV